MSPSERPLTDRQREVLVFIAAFMREKGLPPTGSELRSHFGWGSSRTAPLFLDKLQARGLVTRVLGRAGSLRVTEAGWAEVAS